jgi:tellurite resistance protein TerB
MSDYLSRAWRDGSADQGSALLITLISHPLLLAWSSTQALRSNTVSAREHVTPNQGEIIELSNVHERAAAALVTVGAMVAVADRRVLAVERDEVVHFISDLGLAVQLTESRLAAMFDERVKRLQQRDFAVAIIDALRPVSELSLSSELLAISERVAVADETLHPHEVLAIKLLRLLTPGLPWTKPVEQTQPASRAGQRRGPEHDRERDL